MYVTCVLFKEILRSALNIVDKLPRIATDINLFIDWQLASPTRRGRDAREAMCINCGKLLCITCRTFFPLQFQVSFTFTLARNIHHG